MKKLRVLVLVHEALVPPSDLEGHSEEEILQWKMEYDVVSALHRLGHRVETLGVSEELRPIRRAVEELEPHVVFNLVEEFHGQAVFDQHVVSLLELLRMPYTGCGPRGMVLSRDKALSKKILAYHRIRVPDFHVFPTDRRIRKPARLEFPLIVKSLIEESSTGIAQASVVRDDEELAARVTMVHERIGTDAIAESFIEGRELYVAVLGNHRLEVMPTWELVIEKASPGMPLVATAKVKHDPRYQEKHGIVARAATELPEGVEARLQRTSRRIYRLLDLEGYARIDFRLAPNGRFYFLEANPNPDISADEEFASAAEARGYDYEQLVQKILVLGWRRGRRG